MQAKEIRTVEQLVTLAATKTDINYQFFWGHTPKIPGQNDQSCLSNWFPASFVLEGDTYFTAEHYMMAEKARLFDDNKTRAEILSAKSPGEAKKLGRMVSNFNEKTWVDRRFTIVVNGCNAKFTQNAELGELLLRTGNKVLVEASPTDRIWGIGLSRDHENAAQPAKWRGLNLLGFALMEVRARLSSV